MRKDYWRSMVLQLYCCSYIIRIRDGREDMQAIGDGEVSKVTMA